MYEQVIFAKNIALLVQFVLAQGYYVSSKEISKNLNTKYAHELIYDRSINFHLHNAAGRCVFEDPVYRLAGSYWEFLHPDNKWDGSGSFRMEAGKGNRLLEKIP